MQRLISLQKHLPFAFADTVTVFLLSALLVVLLLLWYTREKKNLPPGPWGLPIVGYLPFLGSEPFRTLDELTKKYGNVFRIRFGSTPVVILGDDEAIKEAYSNRFLLDRPADFFGDIPGGAGFVGDNGKLWIEQRRFTMRSVRNLGLGKGPWEVTIAEEVDEFVKLLQKYNGKAIDISDDLSSSVTRNIVSLLLSKPIEVQSPEGRFIYHSIDVFLKFLAKSITLNKVPGLLKLMKTLNISGLRKCYEDMIKFNEFLMKEVREREFSTSYYDSGDFIGSYLEAMKRKEDEGEKNTTFNETNLQGNLKTLVAGGLETTKTSLQWLFVAMAMHPDKQERIYKELEKFLGDNKAAHWEDRAKIPYTYAAIMEGQRWKTLSPLNVWRQASQDTKVCGYDIPKGTCVVGNLWGLHHDPRYWKEPEKFDPERFLKSNGTIKWKPDSYAPFSLGRRNCPGETIALMEILIYFTAVIRRFRIEPKNPDEEFHVEAIVGQTYQPARHELRFIPRDT